jgi:3-hydroxyacyl-CoA dehydrogenase
MAGPVRFEVAEGIAVATIANPPVNALSAALRGALADAVHRAAKDPDVRALVIAAEGRSWIAGADISEFGKPPVPPTLPELIVALETCPKPIVAAIHAAALGGGLEVAMACTARVLGRGAKLGLPEVKLGLLPGSGGTQRAPRLMGAAAALRLMTSGDPLDAKAAVAAGLGERAGGRRPLAAATAHAATLPRGRCRLPGLGAPRAPGPRDASSRRPRAAKRPRRSPLVAACIAAVAQRLRPPFARPSRRNARPSTTWLRRSSQQGARHVFVGRAGIGQGCRPAAGHAAARRRQGRGARRRHHGAGIAMCFANAGIPSASSRPTSRDARAAWTASARPTRPA